MYSPKKIGVDRVWKYEELPPGALIKSLRLEPAAVDHDELSRAEWFWSRRPKGLSESVSCFFCYVIALVCLLYFAPETLWLLIVWILAGVSCASIEHIRLNRWRNEYESSIKAIVVHLSKRQ
jgi:hypothetical protein